MLAGKRYKNDLEKQKAERINIENSLDCKTMVEKKKANIGNKSGDSC